MCIRDRPKMIPPPAKQMIDPTLRDNTAKTSKIWQRSKKRLKYIWLGENANRTAIWTKEDRDLVWKWLIDDKKD